MPPAQISKDNAQSALWHLGILQWKLWDQQQQIYDVVRSLTRDVQTVVFLCARQFGKSVLGCLLATEDCLQNPNVVVVIVGPTIKQTRAIVKPRMKIIMQDMPDKLIRFVKYEDTYYFSNGSELKLGGFDTNAVAERGKTLYKVYLEEIALSDPDDYNDFIRSDLGPAMTHSEHAQIFYLTTPPKIPDHPFLTETVPEAQLHNAYFEFDIDANKKLTPEKRKQCAVICGGEDTVEYQREYKLKIVRDESIIVVPEFNESVHIQEFELPRFYNAWTGGDMGGTRDRTAFLLCAYDFENDRVLVVDERTYPNTTPTSVSVPEVMTMESQYKTHRSRYVDCAGQTQIDIRTDYKYSTTLPKKEDFDSGINMLRAAFSRGKIVVHPRCKFLITSLRSGTFNKQRTDFARTQALGHCDALAALVYSYRMRIRSNPIPPHCGLSKETHHIVRTDQGDQDLGDALLPNF